MYIACWLIDWYIYYTRLPGLACPSESILFRNVYIRALNFRLIGLVRLDRCPTYSCRIRGRSVEQLIKIVKLCQSRSNFLHLVGLDEEILSRPTAFEISVVNWIACWKVDTDYEDPRRRAVRFRLMLRWLYLSRWTQVNDYLSLKLRTSRVVMCITLVMTSSMMGKFLTLWLVVERLSASGKKQGVCAIT
jgi:hypothetical protein